MKTFLFVTVVACAVACISGQLAGSVSSNPAGGQDANVALKHSFGDDKANIGGGVFAAGNTLKGPVTTGAFVDANKNGHGLSLQHTNTPGFGKTLTETGRVNLFNDNTHKVDANAFHSRTNLENGFKFDRVGGGVNYNHIDGHSAGVMASRIPQIDRNTVGVMGKANLWSSPSRQTTFDLTGTASRSFGGGMPPKNDFGAGVGLTHWFG